MVKVVGGAENTIKCTGVINDAKVIVKETEIIYNNYLISTPLVGKLNIKNSSKI